jgi:hypothetical protein
VRVPRYRGGAKRARKRGRSHSKLRNAARNSNLEEITGGEGNSDNYVHEEVQTVLRLQLPTVRSTNCYLCGYLFVSGTGERGVSNTIESASSSLGVTGG